MAARKKKATKKKSTTKSVASRKATARKKTAARPRKPAARKVGSADSQPGVVYSDLRRDLSVRRLLR